MVSLPVISFHSGDLGCPGSNWRSGFQTLSTSGTLSSHKMLGGTPAPKLINILYGAALF